MIDDSHTTDAHLGGRNTCQACLSRVARKNGLCDHCDERERCESARFARAMPAAATLGPFTYRITEDADEWEACDQDPSGLYGYTDHERGLIIIHARASEAMKRVVLLHELMHAAVFAAGQLDNRKRREEDWVVMTAPMLLDALQRSPELVAYLLGGGQ